MHIKGALFDLDGTLLDTEPIYDAVEQQLINEFGNGEEMSLDIKLKICGTPPSFNSKLLVDTYQIKLTPEEFIKKRDELLIEPFRNSKFKSGAKETTHKCKYDLGLKVAIATSSSKFNFENKTNHLKDWLNEDIDLVITIDDKRIKKGKPAPDIYILAAKELGLEPYECIVFEDALNGVKAAISAGVGIVFAIMEKYQRKALEELIYDKNKTKLVILDSLENFDFSLIKTSK